MHSIVQPPCPEGAAGASCAHGTAGALTAADEFLKATLATITGTPAYREHGLVVVTFATVGIATQAGLPAGASSATLTSSRPRGVVLLSPFAKAGRSTRQPSTRLHPGRASKSCCAETQNRSPTETNGEHRCTQLIPAHRKAALWLAALVGCLALLLATPAAEQGRRIEPEQLQLPRQHRRRARPKKAAKNSRSQYSFYCNGPITGYQLQSQIPVTGIQSPPMVDLATRPEAPLTDTFSCSGEVPGYALNCVGSPRPATRRSPASSRSERKLCAEPRVDPLLTVTYAYLEKGVVTQAISGPFDLGRPLGCKADALVGLRRA